MNLKQTLLIHYFLLFSLSCKSKNMSEPYTNHLAGESSLYLQQHAHNPVDWYPWGDEAWAKAKQENKLVIVSIGYSSCHWCHVMEKQTFMDTATARIMNDYFICIKVDREERPDIDQVYMSAVQIINGSGGWPLNSFTLPDGRPIFGGTYFTKSSWDEILIKLKDYYKNSPDKANQYAAELIKGINQSELIKFAKADTTFSKSILQNAVANWKRSFDNLEGGPNRAPKFPLPGNYQFLLRYAVSTGDTQLFNHVKLTLNKMAFGGIYDQIAGGFARYSTDSFWKVPHFEKMLYDNAQLISLYSSAYKLTQDDLYKQVAIETIDFLKNEMSDGNGGYYSAYDADSEGEEGKYYVWKKAEIENIKFPLCGKADGKKVFSEYFNINEIGYWENNNYILLRKKSNKEIASQFNVSLAELKTFITQSKNILHKKRSERKPPALDKKIITSWNALQVSALCDAYQAFGDENYRAEAKICAEQILNNAVSNEGILLHVRYQKNQMKAGYLEDYAFTISALINLYQITFEEKWLLKAKKIADDAINLYFDDSDKFFWFTSNLDSALITRKKETTDNVIPASNSEMANALFKLADYFDNNKYSDMARQMLASIENGILNYPSSYSNWANLMMNYTFSFNEIVVAGADADVKRKIISSSYLPGALFAGSLSKESTLPLLENRFQEAKTLIYICTNKSCKLPIESAKEAITLLKKDSQNLPANVNYSK